MLFNSIEYLLFFPLVVIAYFLIPKVQWRVYLLLVASYIFYMCWNPVYALLIVFSTIADYFIGKRIHHSQDQSVRKRYLCLSLLINLGVLFYFKYYNFLAENMQVIVDMINLGWYIPEHSLLLPVGISFYSFQTLSYTIDIFFRKMKPESNFMNFALFVSFFPQLVAGPIERASSLLPQFHEKMRVDYDRIVLGLRMILWGMFKKVVVADRLALFVDVVYSDPHGFGGLATLIASIFFVFQIYCDFSGYTDIAIGSAKVLGFDLMENFKGPLLSRNMTEFWRRWHISLSTWIRDYVFGPLNMALRNLGKYSYIVVALISFTVFGFWHGANWTFVLWGVLHGVAIGYETFTRKKRKRIAKKTNPALYATISVLLTFAFWTFTMIIFRANNIADAYALLSNIADVSDQSYFALKDMIHFKLGIIRQFYFALGLIAFISVTHIIEYKDSFYDRINSQIMPVRWSVYIFFIFMIFNFGWSEEVPFVYFQF